MKTIVFDAIGAHFQLELRYHRYSRLVEPYALGLDKSGETILRCYQVSGGSESGERAGWKLLKLAEMYQVAIVKEEFSIRREYRRGDRAMARILCEV